ncbi:MAG: EAL domain-containing protein [Thiohalocapsa sp.]|nr:EAL domain-containing protein [Thiohalocapsa sp.]
MSATDGIDDAEALRERALEALRAGRFDLAEQVLARGDVTIAAVMENLRIYQAELELQNEELIRSQREAEQALGRFRTLFASLPVAELVIDHHGLIIEANPEARSLLELRDPRSHQYFLARLIADRNRGQVIRAWDKLSQTQSIQLPEIPFHSADGRNLIADLHIAKLPAEIEHMPRFVCAVVDRTDAVRQRESLESAYARIELSEERYRVLAEFSPAWDYWVDPDGCYIQVSPACYDITGYSADELTTEPALIERIIHPDDLSLWQAHADGSSGDRRKNHPPLEFRIRTKDGAERWIEHECNPVVTHDGRFLGRRGVNRDITSRREAQEALRRNEALLSSTGRLARVGGWELEPATGAMRLTTVTRELYGFDDDGELDVAAALSFYHPADRPKLERALTEAQTRAKPFELELRLHPRGGGELWIKTTGTPVHEPDGRQLLRGSIQDITGRIQAQRALLETERKYRALFESAEEGMWIIQHGRFVSVNRAALHMLGYSEPADVLGKRPRDISPPVQPDGLDTVAKEEQLLRQALDVGTQRFQWEHLRADGGTLPLEITLIRMELHGEPALFLTWQDLTDKRAAEEREIRARVVFENTSEGIIITDDRQRILAVNRAFTEITGYCEEEVLGQTPRLLQSGRHDEAFYQSVRASLEETGQWRGQIWDRRKNGEIYPQLTTISAVYDQTGRLTNYVGVFGDITQIKRSEEALYKLAHNDALTGLPNRTLLRARLEQSLQRAERYGSMLGLLFLDLDLFKTVNDTLGHSVGDTLLKRVAEAMQTQIRDADSLARLGGDEFIILMEDLAEPNTAAQLARRLLGVFTEPFQAEGRELYITASIGISIYPVDGRDMDTLLSNADVAMYQAKEHGRNTYRFFEPKMTEGAVERLRLETGLRGAILRRELSLVYQPQVKLADGSMHGAEALLRWTHPELGPIPPSQFIRIAEDLGIIGEIGAWVLEHACRQLARWDAAGFLVPRIAVNCSVQQLEQPDLLEDMRRILERTQVEPDRLEIEVTESMLMRQADQVIANLQALRDIGVTIAVDDFGSGFSSLAYLKRLPINRLKIDRAFIEHLTLDANDDAIARAIIALGRELGLDVLAEGVETDAQRAFLAREGCQEAQGYLFGRPMSPQRLMERREQFSD